MGLPQHTFGLNSVRRKIDKIHSRAGELVSRSAAAIENNGTLYAHERRTWVWAGGRKTLKLGNVTWSKKKWKDVPMAAKNCYSASSAQTVSKIAIILWVDICVCVRMRACIFSFSFSHLDLGFSLKKKASPHTHSHSGARVQIYGEKKNVVFSYSVAVCLGRWMRTLGGIASSKQSHLFMRNCLQAEVDENGNWRENEQQQQQQKKNDCSWWWTMELSIRHAIEHYRTVIRGANWIGGFNIAHPTVCRSAQYPTQCVGCGFASLVVFRREDRRHIAVHKVWSKLQIIKIHLIFFLYSGFANILFLYRFCAKCIATALFSGAILFRFAGSNW